MQNKFVNLAVLMGAVLVLGFGAGAANAAPEILFDPTTSPATITQGDPPFSVTVTGRGFGPGTTRIITASSIARLADARTSFIYDTTGSATSRTASGISADVAGTFYLRVGVELAGGRVEYSAPKTATIRPIPSPRITTISPTSKPRGSGTFELTINGTGFRDAGLLPSKMIFNTRDIEISSFSTTQLKGMVPGEYIASAGQYAGIPAVSLGIKTVAVRNGPGGRGNNRNVAIKNFEVTAPANPVDFPTEPIITETPTDTTGEVLTDTPTEEIATQYIPNPCSGIENCVVTVATGTSSPTNPFTASVTSTNIASLVASLLGGFIFKSIFRA